MAGAVPDGPSRSPLSGVGQPDPFASALSVEDRAFLEEFGRKISMAAGASSLVGGVGLYGISRQLNWRRRGLWTALGATLCPFAAWYVVVTKERDRVTALGQKMQLAMGPYEPGEQATGSGQTSADEAMSRLFPPAPTAGVALANTPLPPRGLLGGMQGTGLPGIPGIRPGQGGSSPSS
eukprot:TRINITY_DN60495_c0_g1_i1.p1 TRINITY_DN60495_c0_g1~~TRINITY_DN60495_c0_g1_i1.p1  ORF type:complete len:179 (+),score=27.01 TRINITY_DN60495_c0_g1_i1:63-599(+)